MRLLRLRSLRTIQRPNRHLSPAQGIRRRATYVESLGGGFLPFPIELLNELPNRLRRSDGFLSSPLRFLLSLLVGAGSDPRGIGPEMGVPKSFEVRLLLSFNELAFSFKDEEDSAERPNSRLLLTLSDVCAVSLCMILGESTVSDRKSTILTSLSTPRSSAAVALDGGVSRLVDFNVTSLCDKLS